MKKTHIIALVVVALSIAAIMTSTANYSSYADFATAAANTGKTYQVVGTLAEGKELYYNPEKDPNYFSFYMKDEKGAERKVVYHGAQPQDFERSEQVVLTGHFEGNDFLATEILLKCPSKYIEDQLDENGMYNIDKGISEN